MVDIARPASVARKKKIRRAAFAAAGVVVILLITFGVSRLEPAAPGVERASVWVDAVKRGPMLRLVRGSGTLVPEEIRWIPARTSGRVERILLRPGAVVTPGTVILELSNPELQQQVKEAELSFQSAQAAFENRKAELERQLLTQEADAASAKSNHEDALLVLQSQEKLFKDGLISEIQYKQAVSREADLRNRANMVKKQLDIAKAGVKSQLAPQEAQVDQARATHALRVQQLDELRVRSAMDGVLQQVPVEVGAQVGPGTNLARVANPTKLKAEVRIAETQTKDIRIGQQAEVDTRNGIIKGRVSRIDPSATGGTVGVDITLEEALPPGARPDLSVDGTITLEKLDNVVYVGRPAFGQEHAKVSLFKLVPGTNEAVRVQVTLGRSSVNQIEIVDGLQPGDEVILSDMSAQDAYDKIRLN
jgi:HlyD family secretion protein